VLLRHATRSQLSDLFQNIIRPALQRVSDLTNATPEGDRSQTSTNNSLNNSLYNNPYISSDVIPSSCITSLNLNDSAADRLGDKDGAKMGGFGRTGIMKCSGSSNSSAAGNERNNSNSRRHSYNNMSGRTTVQNMSRKYGSAIITSINSSLSNTNTTNNTQQNTTNNTQNNSANTSTHNSHNDSAFNSAPCSLCPSNIQTQKNSIDALEEGQIVKLDRGEDSSTQDDKSKNLSFTKNDSKLYSQGFSQGLPESSTIVYDQSIIDDFFTAIPAEVTDRSKTSGKEDFLSKALEILNAGTYVTYIRTSCVLTYMLIYLPANFFYIFGVTIFLFHYYSYFYFL
jgi:hypothetical protein